MSAPFLTPGMRKRLRRVTGSMFAHTGDIYRHITVASDFGMSEQWVHVGTSPCWVRQMNNPDLKVDYGGIYTLGIFRVLMPWGTNITVGDRLIVNGSTYLVQNTNVEDTNSIDLVLFVQKLENS